MYILLHMKGAVRVHTTVFDSPGIRAFLRWFSNTYLRLFGWKVEGAVPDIPKMIMIAAPHTSNWDFPITMFLALSLNTKVYWMGKKSLFKKPFGSIMSWLGGIAVDRSKANNAVSGMVDVFNSHDELIVIIPPEGTRGQVTYWKTGFYHIAHGANVPIVLGFVDYGRKAGGIGPTIYPTGDLEADMYAIQSFYATVTAKYPEKSSVAKVDPSRSRKAA
jgi:1-acyl-sn-glycerol-3-phosphate acyltransferase